MNNSKSHQRCRMPPKKAGVPRENANEKNQALWAARPWEETNNSKSHQRCRIPPQKTVLPKENTNAKNKAFSAAKPWEEINKSKSHWRGRMLPKKPFYLEHRNKKRQALQAGRSWEEGKSSGLGFGFLLRGAAMAPAMRHTEPTNAEHEARHGHGYTIIIHMNMHTKSPTPGGKVLKPKKLALRKAILCAATAQFQTPPNKKRRKGHAAAFA